MKIKLLLAGVGILALSLATVAWKICRAIDALPEDHEWVGF
jgi:hypothetical protein